MLCCVLVRECRAVFSEDLEIGLDLCVEGK